MKNDGILSRWLDRGSVPAWKSVAEYERDQGHEVNQSFRIGWAAARTRMSHIERPARRNSQIAATCEWRDEYGVWISACGAAFQFNEDGPTENGFAFCFKCGNPIVVKADAEDLELSANAGIERPMKPQEGRSE